jgi:hypothetical protein
MRAGSGCWSRLSRDRSEDDDAAGSRIASSRERRHDLARPEQWQMIDPATERRKGQAIGARVGNEEDDVSVGIVAQLQGEASLERLSIGDVRLGFDACSPSARPLAHDLRIPRPQVALDRQRHLGSPAERRVEAYPETFEERQLRPIPNRIAGRIGADREVEADHGTVGCHELQRSILGGGSLESADLGMRDADRLGYVSLAEPSTNSSLPRIERHPMKQLAAASPSSIRGPFTRRHRHGWSQGPLHGGFIGKMERPAFKRAKEQPRTAPGGVFARHLERRAFQSSEEWSARACSGHTDRHLEHPAFQGAGSR